MVRVAVLVSGGGTNLQALIDASRAGKLPHAALCAVVSSNPDAYALVRAQQAGIPSETIRRRDFTDPAAFDHALIEALERRQAEVVVLAGFLSILGETFLRRFEGRILNVHPSLLPAFGGRGCYGLKVHELALERGVKVSGATVHLVNEVPDGGKILLQKAVEVLPGDTPETLQRRVMEQAEWVLLPRAVEQLCREMPESPAFREGE